MNENFVFLKKWNADVPVETLYKWKSRECEKLRRQVVSLESTVESLRRNIDIMLDDPSMKYAVKKESVIRTMANEIKVLNKKIQVARADRENLIMKLVQLQQV
ncbi:MAG: hypothetical protein II453_11780 [Alphaproteobacteria bacterium]|nr:hypothetical protein [Alphaproteobacteria bacterium]MBQ3944911.1 hypothetical protein [Alphaproteobacteria bacterium]